MINFTEIKISDFGVVVTGRTPSSSNPEHFGADFPFITPSDIDGRLRHISVERYISIDGKKTLNRIQLPAKSVCVVCIGATIGKICMTKNVSFSNQQINSIVVDQEKYDPYFVYYFLGTLKDIFKSHAGGSATPILNKTSFSNLLVQVPEKMFQRRIGAILSNYDDLIENNTQRIVILEEMARRIYEEWFVNYRFPGHEAVPMVESELGPVPDGWEPMTLGQLAYETRDSVHPNAVPSDTPYVGLEHIPRRSLALGEWGIAEDVQSTKLRFSKGDILFGKIRPYFHKVVVAPVSGVASSDAIVIRSRVSSNFSLVLSIVSSDAFVAHATQSSNGTKMPRANWAVLVQYPVALPPPDLLEKFNSFITPALAQIMTLTLKNRNLRQTRDLLLPRLISGELDVSTLPMPEDMAA